MLPSSNQPKANRKVIGRGFPILHDWIVDARGSKVWVSRAGKREWWWHSYWTIRRWGFFESVSGLLCVTYVFAFTFGLVLPAIAKGSSIWRWLLILIPALPLIWALRAFRRSMARNIVESWLLSRLCIHCRYDLSRLESDFDGCTVCPECGAAWKLNAPLSERVPE